MPGLAILVRIPWMSATLQDLSLGSRCALIWIGRRQRPGRGCGEGTDKPGKIHERQSAKGNRQVVG